VAHFPPIAAAGPDISDLSGLSQPSRKVEPAPAFAIDGNGLMGQTESAFHNFSIASRSLIFMDKCWSSHSQRAI
jgi:hypothetical protein